MNIYCEDNRRDFCERVMDEQEDIISALKTVVRCWTENQIEDCKTPRYEEFIREYPEWRHSELYEVIMTEMERSVKSCKNALADFASGQGKSKSESLKVAGE